MRKRQDRSANADIACICRKVVAGKYFAMAAVYTIDIALFALSPLVLSIYGKVALSEAYVALFGYWLYGLFMHRRGTFYIVHI